jgi:transcriptional regulator with XRE-family HTH domain
MTSSAKDRDDEQALAVESFIVDAQFRIHQLLKEAGVSQSQLAEKLGLSKARVSAMFGPKPNLTLETMGRIFAALNEPAVLTSPRIERRLRALRRKVAEGARARGFVEADGPVLGWQEELSERCRAFIPPSSVWSQATPDNHNSNPRLPAGAARELAA